MKSRTTIVLVIIIVFIFTYFFMKEPFVEPFTPGLRRVYRPYIRRARVHATKVYDNFIKKSRVLLTKFGVI